MRRKPIIRRFIKSSALIAAVAVLFACYPIFENQLSKAALISASVELMTPLHKPDEQTSRQTEIPFLSEEKTENPASAEIPFESDVSSDIPSDASDASSDGEPPLETKTEPEEIPAAERTKPVNAGVVTRKTYFEGGAPTFIPLNHGFIKNCTSLSHDEVAALAAQTPKFKIKADGSPEVLIMHTHTTESYQPYESEWFDRDYTARDLDNSKNVTAVGDKIADALSAAGIGVIHDKTLHDYPSYNGAYERSAKTVNGILAQNPSIRVVLDVHRDAIQPSDDSIVAPVATIDGRKCAQVMIISGCDDGTMNMPDFRENLKFAALLQNQLAADYGDIARPVLFDYRRYNQDLTTGSLLLEVGGHANSLDEALCCGELIGNSLTAALLSLD